MCTTSGEHCSKDENLFNAIYNAFTLDEVFWEQWVSTNVKIGYNDSIKSKVQKNNRSFLFVGCNCHLAHIGASNRRSSYSNESGFDMAHHIVDLYYNFKNSTRRTGILNESALRSSHKSLVIIRKLYREGVGKLSSPKVNVSYEKSWWCLH